MESLNQQYDLFSQPQDVAVKKETYAFLDVQLANLLQEINGAKNKTLENCTLEISKHTREGQIAIVCTAAQQNELLKTRVVGEAGEYKPLILDDGYLYLNRYWQYQHILAENIKSRLGEFFAGDEQYPGWIKTHVDQYFKADNQNLATDETNWQQVAASLALIHQFLIISGGPGTGKTTTITRILALLIEQQLSTKPHEKLRILLAAPTGKAAIRMLDAISNAQQILKLADDVSEQVIQQMPVHASTIHKLLGYQPHSVQFKYNRLNPLNADVVLVDEASMIDIALMAKLLEAVPQNAKLILIGDKNQLSSVETGSVFSDICGEKTDQINSSDNQYSPAILKYLENTTGRAVATTSALTSTSTTSSFTNGLLNDYIVSLQKNWRFSDDSGISQLAVACNAADSETVHKVLRDKNIPECSLLSPQSVQDENLMQPWQHYFKVLKNPASTLDQIFKAFDQYRILCALRRGLNGSENMSRRIESAMANKGWIKTQSATGKTHNWYHGKPVMVTQNSYDKGLYNGDTGITLIDDKGQAKIWFLSEKDGFKAYAPVRLPTYETTWAMTIHKSQGSEFNQVTLILPHEVMPILTRQLIYTGITRAKEIVNIVASEEVLAAGVKTEVVKATCIGKKLAVIQGKP